MNYSTFDRFQGAWLGSIIGLSINSLIQEKPKQNWLAQALVWLELRNAIAKLIVETQNLNEPEILAQLLELDRKEVLNQRELQVNCTDQQDNNSSSYEILSARILLGSLPLILFYPEPQSIYPKLIKQLRLQSSQSAERAEDILVWNYLLNLILKNQLLYGEVKLSNLIERILGGVEIRNQCFAKQLNIVHQAWFRNLSLRELTEEFKLNSTDQENTMATSRLIPLSLYCFASTPNNFMLSVRRASYFSDSVIALTATMSGAYNGVALIPRNWQAVAQDCQIYQQAQATIATLFKTWLGLYHPLINSSSAYDSVTDVIAVPKIIQTRPTLKIISQKWD